MMPCGCPEGACICTPENITPRGTFLRTCKWCGLEWEGERMAAVAQWWQHVKTPEHDATYARVRDEVARREAEQREAEAARTMGWLW